MDRMTVLDSGNDLAQRVPASGAARRVTPPFGPEPQAAAATPRASRATTKTRPGARVTPAPGESLPITVMLADDHGLVRHGIRALLETESGIEVVGEAEDGPSAVALAVQLRPQVLIMDVTMPGLDGAKATRQVRAGAPEVRVLALTVRSEKRFVLDMLEAGVSGYLSKGCGIEELVAAIREVAQGRSHFSQTVLEMAAEEYISASHTPTDVTRRPLTPRQREVLRLLAEGKSSKQVAHILGLAGKTVETHRARIMARLGTTSVAELTRYAIREGLIPLDD
jgi:DNA-binding NarL/FixJ family response regulator